MGSVPAPSHRPPPAALPIDAELAPAALVVAALAVGESLISRAGEGPVLQATARALRALGAEVVPRGGDWRVRGVGIGGLAEPAGVIDLQGAAAVLPLILGMAATHPLTCFLAGDAGPSLARLIEPLQRLGARFLLRDGATLPLGLAGARHPLPGDHRLTAPGAEVKAAILLAGLNTPGTTRVIEPAGAPPAIDAVLRHFGAEIRVDSVDGTVVTALAGQPELAPCDVTVRMP